MINMFKKAPELVGEKEYEFCIFSLPASTPVGINVFITADLTLQHLGDAQGFPQHLSPKRKGTGEG